MKRDGALESLWQFKLEDYQPNNNMPSAEEEFDVLIAGGGMTGIVTGFLLQKAGKKCIIAEAHTLGFGTSGGTTAHLNTFFDTTYAEVSDNFGKDEAALLALAAQESINLVKQHTGEYNIACDLEEKTGYVFSLNEEQDKALEKLVESSKEVNVAMDIINDSPFPIPYTKIASVPGQAQFHPSAYIFGLAKAFEAAGGIILTGCRVTGTDEASVIIIKTSKGDIKARNLIWATHIPPGVNLLHFRAAPYRSYVIGVTLNDNNYPDAMGYDMEDPYHYYRSHTIDGKKYFIAGGEDHKTAHEENTEVCFRNLESYVRKYFDVKEVAFKWSSQYYQPADGLPYIGHLPGNGDNIYVATGYGGNGMMYSHIAAMTLSDILLKGDSKYRKLFDPNRVKPVAGFAEFVKEGADVVKNFISGKFSAEKIKSFSELAAGEAKVVKYEGEKIAMYKDEQHTVHAVNPSCTHVHCTVSWNSAERSWDCPCHGARFSCTGEVLNGPAVKDLEKIEII
ncbi:MAG: FAD-dependent oxidoreductase [Ferruginibacter sp.]